MAEKEQAKEVLGRVKEAFLSSGLPWVAPEKEALLQDFINEVLVWSKRVHLVGKRNLFENVCNQLRDSLILFKIVEDMLVVNSLDVFNGPGKVGGRGLMIGDIGSGAGFPGIIWKIVAPDARITLFERRLSPARFLKRTARLLGLRGLEVVEMDVEVMVRAGKGERRGGLDEERERFRNAFDIVLAKASGELATLLPIASELLVNGGVFVTFKSRKRFDEWRLAREKCEGFEPAGIVEAPMNRGLVLFFRKVDGE